MILHFMGDGDEESSKLNNKEKRVLRWVWAALLAFFMSLLGYQIGRWSNFLELVVFNRAYYVDLFFSYLLLGVVMEYIYGITRYLDLKQPWSEGYYKRMFIQMLLAIIGGLLFMEVCDGIYKNFAHRHLIRMDYGIFQIPFSLILPLAYSFFCCIESLGDAYFKLLEREEELYRETDEPSVVEDNPIIAIKEGEEVRLSDIPVSIIWHNDGINYIYYAPEEYYEDNRTLASLYSYLDKEMYRRVGRNAVVHRELIAGYRPRSDKGVILELAIGYNQKVIVSKMTCKTFCFGFKIEINCT
ncbi:hypothetical protein SAMN05660841_01849 [Sphingobacterium nematocida]|uniref:LytTr DNA-binding domain-containing protein n=1 Tax=Sphingobacterium nematocida TaxID=1513896 RepID=A0A1T5D9E8_9SPHI|nr:hypothetical protein [Sphingobacterium nematocida]SKB68110.1 hypothetical protein SAMN05660841_01849 [Sphingobacterium nematocida]